MGISISTFAQNYVDSDYYLIDSLDLSTVDPADSMLVVQQLAKYHSAETDTGAAAAIDHLVNVCWDHNIWVPYNDWLYDFFNEKLETVEDPEIKRLYLKGKSGSLGNKAFYLTMTGETEKALEIYEESLEVFKSLKDAKGVGEIYNNIAAIYDSHGDLLNALDYYQKSLEMRILAKDEKGRANTLNNIGYIYIMQKDFETARIYYEESLQIREEIEDSMGLANSYNNMALLMQSTGDTSLALEYYHQSLEIRQIYRFTKDEATTLNNIGFIHYRQKNYKKALEYFSLALDKNKSANFKQGVALSSMNLGLTHFALKNYSVANNHALKAYRLSSELGYPDLIMRSSDLMYKLNKQRGDYKGALTMLETELEMKDSLVNEEKFRATQKLQAQIEYEKKQAELEKEQAIKDANYENEIALQEEQKQKQQILTFIGFGALILVIAFLAFVFNRLKITRRQKNEIDQQKIELEVTHQQLEAHHKEISDSIQYAKRIQEAIMPSMETMKAVLQNGFVLYLPKDVVAGDFYWMEHIDDKVYFAAADCTGHGVPGAMVSVVCSNALNKAILEEGIRETGKLLDRTREIVIERLAKSGDEVKDGMDISLCALNKSTLELQWSGANNPLWILRNGQIEEIKADKQPIGIYANSKPYTTHNIQLNKGDKIYVATDGLQDQFGGPKGKKLKAQAIRDLLIEHSNKTMNDQKVVLEKAFYDWKGKLEQVDDICMIGIQV